jgi:hypothetical protein
MPNKTIWIVVEVQSGIPVEIKTFPTFELANAYSEELRNSLNLDNDETGVFSITLD